MSRIKSWIQMNCKKCGICCTFLTVDAIFVTVKRQMIRDGNDDQNEFKFSIFFQFCFC